MDWKTILNTAIGSSLSTFLWVAFCLIVVWLIRKPLIDILNLVAHIGNKATKINYKDINITLGGDSLQMSQNPQYSRLQNAFQKRLVVEEKEIIKNQLKNADLTQEQSIDILVDHLANRHLIIALLYIDASKLYTEQIEMLAYLNNRPLCTESELQVFYHKWNVNKNEGRNNYPFEKFVGYVLKQGLIVRNSEGWEISILGREYLAFLVYTYRLPLPEQITSNQNVDIKQHEESI